MGTPLGPEYIYIYTIYLHGPFGDGQVFFLVTRNELM